MLAQIWSQMLLLLNLRGNADLHLFSKPQWCILWDDTTESVHTFFRALSAETRTFEGYSSRYIIFIKAKERPSF
jgi:hypothetical protein